jgi:hypothetical protein
MRRNQCEWVSKIEKTNIVNSVDILYDGGDNARVQFLSS